ncbi:hypothetical protein STEG23_007988, partial [Scotinomys teguina]
SNRTRPRTCRSRSLRRTFRWRCPGSTLTPGALPIPTSPSSSLLRSMARRE